MSYYLNEEFPETSHQGTLRMIQQDLQSHMNGADEKIERLQRQIELLVVGMNKKSTRNQGGYEFQEEEDDYKENVFTGSTGKGMFRDPLHVAFERQRTMQRQSKLEDEVRTTAQGR